MFDLLIWVRGNAHVRAIRHTPKGCSTSVCTLHIEKRKKGEGLGLGRPSGWEMVPHKDKPPGSLHAL